VQIHWAQFPERMNTQRAAAEERLQRLELSGGELQVHIAARAIHLHGQRGQVVTVRCRILGRELLACCQRESLGGALHEAVESFERQVHELRERRRSGRTCGIQVAS
jgi:ribosome-associated translation inhibitor RaiA